MRTRLASLFLFTALQVQAQFQARIVMDYPEYLLYEPVEGRLIIENVSGRNLQFTPDQFKLLGRMFRHQHLPRLVDQPITDSITIPAGERRETRIDFSKVFRVTEVGPYTFGASIEYFGRTVHLPYVYVDIVRGVEILQRETIADSPEGPRHRLVKLINMMRKGDNTLFLAIEDPLRRLSYGVYELGPLLAQGKPTVQMSEDNNLHILHRTSPAQYLHSIFTLNGTPVSREIYDSGATEPEMRKDRFGSVSVLGGRVENSGESRIKAFTLE